GLTASYVAVSAPRSAASRPSLAETASMPVSAQASSVAVCTITSGVGDSGAPSAATSGVHRCARASTSAGMRAAASAGGMRAAAPRFASARTSAICARSAASRSTYPVFAIVVPLESEILGARGAEPARGRPPLLRHIQVAHEPGDALLGVRPFRLELGQTGGVAVPLPGRARHALRDVGGGEPRLAPASPPPPAHPH